jgi:hypothetical protein
VKSWLRETGERVREMDLLEEEERETENKWEIKPKGIKGQPNN